MSLRLVVPFALAAGFVATSVTAQPSFLHAVGVNPGSGDDFALALAVDSGTNAYAAGAFRDSLLLATGLMLAAGGLGQDAVLVKRGPTGTVLWARAGGGTATTSLDVAHGVAIDAAGNAFLAGAYSGAAPSAFGAFPIAAGGDGAFLVRYAPDGTEQWAVSLAADATAWDVAVDGTGHAWVAGSEVGGAWIREVDATTGGTLATWNFAGLALDDDTRLSVAPDGDLVLSGKFAGTVDFDPGAPVADRTASGASDGFLARFTPAGALLWIRVLAGTGADVALDHDTDALGASYLCGQLASAGTLDGVPGSTGFVVAKMSPGGDIAWVRNTYSQFAGFNSGLEARRITAHDPGAYTIAGARRQAFGTIGGVPLPGEQHSHAVQYSDAGAVQWVKFVKGASLAASLPEVTALWAGPGDLFYLAGRNRETVSCDAIVLADVNGSSKWAMFSARLGSVPVAVESPPGSVRIALRAGPNPFTAGTTLEFSPGADGGVVGLELRDVRGRRVRTLFAGPASGGTQRVRVDGRDLPAGLYFAVLCAGGARTALRLVHLD